MLNSKIQTCNLLNANSKRELKKKKFRQFSEKLKAKRRIIFFAEIPSVFSKLYAVDQKCESTFF